MLFFFLFEVPAVNSPYIIISNLIQFFLFRPILVASVFYSGHWKNWLVGLMFLFCHLTVFEPTQFLVHVIISTFLIPCFSGLHFGGTSHLSICWNCSGALCIFKLVLASKALAFLSKNIFANHWIWTSSKCRNRQNMANIYTVLIQF